MNSPFNYRFKVTQTYKENIHKGLDLVGLDSKEVHATVSGIVNIARWENPNNHKQGFGQYVMIHEENSKRCFIYAHLSKILVRAGDYVKNGDVIGIEGDTGYSFGSHCHYEVRIGDINGSSLNVSNISGIPNKEGIYDDGYRPYVDDIDNIVIDVISGVYGNGEERKQKLGNNYKKVQEKVNHYLKVANDVINGVYGNGLERKELLERSGYNYKTIQTIVNIILGV